MCVATCLARNSQHFSGPACNLYDTPDQFFARHNYACEAIQKDSKVEQPLLAILLAQQPERVNSDHTYKESRRRFSRLCCSSVASLLDRSLACEICFACDHCLCWGENFRIEKTCREFLLFQGIPREAKFLVICPETLVRHIRLSHEVKSVLKPLKCDRGKIQLCVNRRALLGIATAHLGSIPYAWKEEILMGSAKSKLNKDTDRKPTPNSPTTHTNAVGTKRLTPRGSLVLLRCLQGNLAPHWC